MVTLRDVYVVDFVRTPFDRSRPKSRERTAFSEVRMDQLVGYTLRNIFEVRLKGKLKPEEVSEFSLGSSFPVGPNWPYGGRNAWFSGNMPASVPALFIDRLCGSGMTSMHHGIMSIQTGFNDIFIASGGEQMFQVPMDSAEFIRPPSHLLLDEPGSMWYRGDVDLMTGFSMVQTAQKLWEEEADHIPPQLMAEFSVRSHQKATKALDEGYFKDEIVPVMGHVEGDLNQPWLVDHDLSIMRNISLEKTLQLEAVSNPGFMGGYKNKKYDRKEYKEKFGTRNGMITPGNSSPLNAGAATIMVMDGDSMRKHNLKPMAKIVSMGWAGVDPSVMGRGPVPSTEMALKKAHMTADQIDYWEVNEAFAVVALNFMHHFKISEEKVNVKGGAIAIGHPLGASGIRLTGTLARILKEKKAKYGVATLCCGSGQGVTTIIENPDV